MNREERRRFYKRNRKSSRFGSWHDWNEEQYKERPYINVEKRARKAAMGK